MKTEQTLPKGYFIVGRKLMGICNVCECVVRIDKPIFGSFHFCLSEEERKAKIMLTTYRYRDDARVRIGKILQAADDGVSISGCNSS